MRQAEFEERFRNVKLVFEKLLKQLEKEKKKEIDKTIPVERDCIT